ncbi:unnamed protein product [Linum tenue]|uniref:Transmembrane protein n=1 Tax=Linum tenue TaxID=586396 RepID=A0AAV0N1N2_9ROSI|nr:unnamed protein product [Linum tenue]
MVLFDAPVMPKVSRLLVVWHRVFCVLSAYFAQAWTDFSCKPFKSLAGFSSSRLPLPLCCGMTRKKKEVVKWFRRCRIGSVANALWFLLAIFALVCLCCYLSQAMGELREALLTWWIYEMQCGERKGKRTRRQQSKFHCRQRRGKDTGKKKNSSQKSEGRIRKGRKEPPPAA